jgi:outer membrane protein assembly factor BamB
MTKFRRWRFMAMVALGASLILLAGGCDWLQVGFSGGGDNANPYEAALTASTVGSLTQKYTLGSTTPPVIADGTLYAGTSTGVSAVRGSDGLPIWTATLPAGSAFGIAEDTASGTVIASAPGTLYGLDAATGTIRWSDLIAGLESTPVLDAGKLFVDTSLSGTGTVLAIDPASGSTLWTGSFPTLFGGGGRLIAGSGIVYVNYGAASGYPGTPGFYTFGASASFNESDGTLVNSEESGTVAMAADGLVYYVSGIDGEPGMAAVNPNTGNPSTGTTVWTASGNFSPDAVSADLLMSGLTALDPQTGATTWTASLPSGTTIAARPIIAGTLVYLVGTDGTNSTLYAFDGATGAQVAAVSVAGGAATSSQLVISEGMVFVTVNGTITAYAPTS